MNNNYKKGKKNVKYIILIVEKKNKEKKLDSISSVIDRVIDPKI